MSDAGWGIVFVLGLAGCVTLILTTVLWQVFQIAKIKTRMALDEGRSDNDRQTHQQATAEH